MNRIILLIILFQSMIISGFSFLYDEDDKTKVSILVVNKDIDHMLNFKYTESPDNYSLYGNWSYIPLPSKGGAQEFIFDTRTLVGLDGEYDGYETNLYTITQKKEDQNFYRTKQLSNFLNPSTIEGIANDLRISSSFLVMTDSTSNRYPYIIAPSKKGYYTLVLKKGEKDTNLWFESHWHFTPL